MKRCLISDAAFEGSDALATTHILAQAIKKLGDVDLVVFGKQAIDGDTGLVPAGVARRLGWPLLSYVAKIDELDPGSKSIKVTRLLEQGRQSVGSKLPAVISVVKEINEPRYPSFMNIRKASKLQIPDHGCRRHRRGGGQGRQGQCRRAMDQSLPAARAHRHVRDDHGRFAASDCRVTGR